MKKIFRTRQFFGTPVGERVDMRAAMPQAFTLVELLIAISILGIISVTVSSLYIDQFKGLRRSSFQNSVYEDAGFIMNQIAQTISQNHIDYDEYYNRHVVIPRRLGGDANGNLNTYGQNFGKYYSAFFHPGDDDVLGYRCNTGERNLPGCTPERRTLDKHTGQNPYTGRQPQSDPQSAHAFCADDNCHLDLNNAKEVAELYLISPDSKAKTIIARERIGGTVEEPLWALSRVKLAGSDSNNDGVIDRFVCADGYECGGTQACPSSQGIPENLPRITDELTPTMEQFGMACDSKDNAFAHDFVPISPLRVDVMDLKFYIAPLEDPEYAFSETAATAIPMITVVMKIRPNPEMMQDKKAFDPITLVMDVKPLRGQKVAAPLQIQ